MMTDKRLPVNEIGIIVDFPRYNCETHGEHSNYIESDIPDYKGFWCQRCWLESLDKMGIKRMTKIEK